MAILYGVARSTDGKIIPDATVTIYDGGTTTAATIYSDAALTTTTDNPLTSDSDSGEFSCYVPHGEYDVVVSRTGFTTTTITNFPVAGLDSGEYRISATSNGGSGMFGFHRLPATLTVGADTLTLTVDEVVILRDDGLSNGNLDLEIKCYNSSDVLQWTADAVVALTAGTGYAYPSAASLTAGASLVTDLQTDIDLQTLSAGDIIVFNLADSNNDEVDVFVQLSIVES